MVLEAMSAAQYRALDLDALNERKATLLSIAADADCEVEPAMLQEEMKRCADEYDSRKAAVELRKKDVEAVLGGNGLKLEEKSFRMSDPEADADVYGTKEYERAFFNYVCRGQEMPAQFRDADAYTNTTDIPVMIPTTLSTKIIEKMTIEGEIWNRVTKTNLKGGVEYPVLDLKPEAHWVGENEVSAWQKVLANQKVVFTYHELECRIASTMLAAIVSFDELMRRFPELASRAMIRALDQMVIRGTGSGQGLGIVNDPRVAAYGHTVSMTEADVSNWKMWKKKVKKVIPRLYRNGQIIMAQSTFDGYIETLSNDNNTPISAVINPMTGEENYRFMGFEIITVDDEILPDFDEADNGEVFCIYCRLEDYAVNCNQNMMQVAYDDWDARKKKLVAYMVADGKVLDPYGMVLVKKDETGSLNIDFSVPAASTALWDKTAGDIQSNITLGNGLKLNGTSKYVADWTSKGFDMNKGHHFLSLHVKGLFGQDATGVTCVAECVPSQGSPTQSFNDDEIVMQIQDSGLTQGIKVIASKSDVEDKEIIVDISNIILGSE